MALTISKLKMWRNPGYSKGCMEVPPLGSKKLPAPDYTLAATETLRPLKDSTLTQLNLPLSFSQTFGMSYLYIEATDGAGSIALFGWVDGITQRSTSAEGITLSWSVDWWRSYSGDVSFGSGRILRSGANAAALYNRPYHVHPRKWEYGYCEKILSPNNKTGFDLNVIIVYNETINASQPHITQITMLCFPIKDTASNTSYEFTSSLGTAYRAPSTNEVFSGQVDELLQIDSDSITAIYLSPVLPTSNVTYIKTGITQDSKTLFAFKVRDGGSAGYFEETLTNTYYSGDDQKMVVMDPLGSIVYTMPWGYMAKYFSFCLDIGSVGANLIITLTDTTQALLNVGLKAPSKGLSMTIPLIAVPFNSNAWESYNYSGKRDYDIRMKEIQREQQAVTGLTSIGTSTAAGAIGGAMVGSAPGAIAGAVVGAGGSVINTGINYAVSGIYNEKIQEATDKLYSNQASSIIQSAGGAALLNPTIVPGGWYFVQLLSDTESSSAHIDDLSTYGYIVDLALTDVTSYIPSGSVPSLCGGCRIENLTVTGAVPPQAKGFIKDRFSAGVIMIEKNPTGMVP